MKRSTIGLGVLFTLVLLPFGAVAQSIPAKSNAIYSPDASYLTFDGAPDENGLIVLFGFPKAMIRDWPVAVYNATDAPIKNLTLEVSEIVDGQPQLYNDAVHLTPLVIQPGDWGFAGFTYRVGGQSMPIRPANGEDAEFSIRVVDPIAGYLPAVDLQVTSAQLSSSGNLGGSILNTSGVTVQDILVQYLCVENSGFPIEFEERALSQKRLKDGMSVEFGFEAGTCNGSYFVTANAWPS